MSSMSNKQGHGSQTSAPWMIYGANGYTGKLILAEALARGHRPIVAGRNAPATAELAKAHGLEARVFALGDRERAAKALTGVRAVLHCAGPFSQTSMAMLDACVAAKCAYLDITGEIVVFEQVFARTSELASAGVAAIPGVGFDVVPTDTVALRLKTLLPDATSLKLVLDPKGSQLSRGTLKTLLEGLGTGGRARVDGKIVVEGSFARRTTVQGTRGPKTAVSIPWGDVSTAFYTTGIPNIATFMVMPARDLKMLPLVGPLAVVMRIPGVVKLAQKLVDKTVTGPTDDRRASAEMRVHGEATNAAGKRVTARLRTADGYTFTAGAAVRAVERLLKDALRGGAHTPAGAFGVDFALDVPGTSWLD